MRRFYRPSIILLIFILILGFSFYLQAEEQKDKEETALRNPFQYYNSPDEDEQEEESEETGEEEKEEESQEPRLTPEEVREKVNFKLIGIIDSSRERIALVKNTGKSRMVQNNQQLGEFTIISINKESITTRYGDFRLEMRIGGEIVEVE